MKAICPGSFDPVTLGHVDIFERAADQYESVLLAVGMSATKKGMFTADERVELLQQAVRHLDNVEVATFDGLLVDLCTERGIGVIVKGLRSGADFEYELQMAQMNSRLTGVETSFLATAPEWGFVSSTLIRQISSMGGDVSPFVPSGVLAAVTDRVWHRGPTSANHSRTDHAGADPANTTGEK